MSDDATLVYLEPDDEITTVVRRLREAEGARVILVAPGRTKATTSAVALRLLAGLAREDGREIVLVGDASARSLAAEAGIPAVASVADARSLQPGATPSAGTPDRAQISVVRGERRAVAPLAPGRPRRSGRSRLRSWIGRTRRVRCRWSRSRRRLERRRGAAASVVPGGDGSRHRSSSPHWRC